MKQYFVMMCILCGGAAVSSADPIYIYDLRAKSQIDCSDNHQVNREWDNCHLVSCLQGIVNRDKPRLYLIYINSQSSDQNIDEYWLDKYTTKGQWLGNRESKKIASIEVLLATFKDSFDGLVVYDPNVPATSNVASAVAGADNLLPVRFDKSPESLFSLLTGKLKLKVKVWLVKPDGSTLFKADGQIPGTTRFTTGSSKCDAYIWMKQRYMDTGRCSGLYGAYYIDYFWAQKSQATVMNHHCLTNHDYFVSKRAFFFDLGPWADEPATDDPCQVPGTDRKTLCELLLGAYKQAGGDRIIHIGGFPSWAYKYTQDVGGKHHPVHTEWEYTAVISAYNAFQDADAIGFGAIANASFWQHFPLKNEYPQKWVSHEELQKKGYLTEDGKVKFNGRNFIIFYVGDYDSAAWVYQRMGDMWSDPNRGKVPLMWCVSPVLDRRVPMIMDYMREEASENDYFAAADNGAGYLNPGALQQGLWPGDPRPISNLPSGLNAWQTHCESYYKRWGLSITGFVIDGFTAAPTKATFECYSKFSPNGIVPQKVPFTFLYKDMPILRSGDDINNEDPHESAKVIVKSVQSRPIAFHWFRTILKTPSWHYDVAKELKMLDPKIELVDAPTFFELYRIWLKQNPDAAKGRIFSKAWWQGYEH